MFIAGFSAIKGEKNMEQKTRTLKEKIVCVQPRQYLSTFLHMDTVDYSWHFLSVIDKVDLQSDKSSIKSM